jgi:hypothetical protein
VAITVVQSKALSSSSWSGSFNGNVTAGSTVFLFAFQYTNSGAAMGSGSPAFGGNATPGASMLLQQQGPGTATVYGTIWMLPDLPGGAASCALTSTGGIVDTNVGIIGIEVSGLGASPQLDPGASPNPETGSGTSTALSSGATGDITAAAEIIVALAIPYGTSVTLPGGAWSGLETGSGQCAAGWQVPGSSGGSYTYTATGGSAQSWAAGVAAVEPASGPSPGPAYTACMSSM